MATQSPSLLARFRRLFSVTVHRRLLPPLRHPHGFYLLCWAVFCERWAAAILGSSVVFMLCERYGYGRSDALRLAGLYNAASYLLTLPGGFAVDRSLGGRRSLGAGMALLMLGYAALTLPATSGLGLAIVFLLLGHSLFKPSTQAVMVLLYERHDPRLDAAQIVCYLVVNVAGIAGPVSAGLLVHGHDFRAAFVLAAAILFTGLIAVMAGNKILHLRQKQPAFSALAAPVPIDLSAMQRIKIIAALTLAMMIFTVGFGQVEGALFLWAQDRTDRMLLGFELPAAWFVGLPALLVLLLAPAQLALLPRIQHRVSTPRLIAWGLVAVVLAFVVLIPPAVLCPGQRVSMAWLIACMTLLVIGELLVAPLGLSLLLRLAPPRFVGVVVGVWYVAGALGCWLAGEIGAVWVR
ncbi:MAG: MFS transporter [Myxococcales bacterium]|nr:MFS transporter [Myxococcales bacterium]